MSVRCAHCKDRHDTVQGVRECSWEEAEARAEQVAELAAEAANERFWENRGTEDAWAQEDYERRMGVVSFSDAYAAAMGGSPDGLRVHAR